MNYKIFHWTCTEVHKTFLKASEITINTGAVQLSSVARWKFQQPQTSPLRKHSVTTLQLFKQFSKILRLVIFGDLTTHWFGALREKKTWPHCSILTMLYSRLYKPFGLFFFNVTRNSKWTFPSDFHCNRSHSGRVMGEGKLLYEWASYFLTLSRKAMRRRWFSPKLLFDTDKLSNLAK